MQTQNAVTDASSGSLRRLVWRCIGWAVVFSGAANLLMLTVPIYLMQLFDRVLVSRSVDTLWTLTLIATFALLVFGVVDAVRRLLLAQLGAYQQIALSEEVISDLIQPGPKSTPGGTPSQLVGHCDTLRGFLGSAAVMPLFDAPWSPIFLLACFLLHPWLGWVALSAFVLLCVVCLGNEALTRERTKRSQAALKESARFSQGLRGKADAIRAMGFRPALTAVSQQRLDSGLLHWLAASGRQLRLSALARVLRLALQIVVLATGAWLVVDAAMSPGAMIAASILVTRALAPVEQLIGSWPQTLAAIKAYRSLRTGLDQLEPAYPAPLPVPDGVINVEKLIYAHPGQTAEPLLRNLTFSLDAGESLAIIGPSGSGKSTLARLLVGLLKPSSGSIRLDAISVSDWPEEQRGRYTGYLPQDIQLISGTVAQNIARFAPVTYATQVEELTQDQSVNTPEAELFSSARLAGAHDAICRMPEGYNTPIGPGGLAISGGEQQLVGLARAIYGPVRFVVLDEPNANQDRAGEDALLATLASLKQRGVTTILIAHRPAMLKHVDKVLVLQDGIITQYGPRDAVLQNLRG